MLKSRLRPSKKSSSELRTVNSRRLANRGHRVHEERRADEEAQASPVHLDKTVRRVQKVAVESQAIRASPGRKVQRGLLDLEARKESQVLQVTMANQVVVVNQVMTDHAGQRARRDARAKTVNQVNPVKMVNRVRGDPREVMASRASRVQKVHRGRRGQTVRGELTENRVRAGRKAHKAPVALMAIVDQPDHRADLERQVIRDRVVTTADQAPTGSADVLEVMASQDRRVHLETQAPLVHRVLVALLVLMANRASQATMASLGPEDRRARKDQRVDADPKERMVNATNTVLRRPRLIVMLMVVVMRPQRTRSTSKHSKNSTARRNEEDALNEGRGHSAEQN